MKSSVLNHESAGRGGIEIDSSSLTGFLSDYNILARVSVDDTAMSLLGWQSTYAQDAHSFSQTAAQTFVSSESDYHLLAAALAVDGGTSLPEITDDVDGNPRSQGAGYDIGAYERTITCPPCSGPRVENAE